MKGENEDERTATCVGVRDLTKNFEMLRQSPFPYCSRPSRNILCSSVVHGTFFRICTGRCGCSRRFACTSVASLLPAAPAAVDVVACSCAADHDDGGSVRSSANEAFPSVQLVLSPKPLPTLGAQKSSPCCSALECMSSCSCWYCRFALLPGSCALLAANRFRLPRFERCCCHGIRCSSSASIPSHSNRLASSPALRGGCHCSFFICWACGCCCCSR